MAENNRPTHDLFAIVPGNREGDKDRFLRLGGAWESTNNAGERVITFDLELLPTAWEGPGRRRLMLQPVRGGNKR